MEINNKLESIKPSKKAMAVTAGAFLGMVSLVYMGDAYEPIQRDGMEDVADEDNLRNYVSECDKQAHEVALNRIKSVAGILEGDTRLSFSVETEQMVVKDSEAVDIYIEEFGNCLNETVGKYITEEVDGASYDTQMYELFND